MSRDIRAEILDFDPNVPLARAWSIPASWYLEPEIDRLERTAVFAASWQIACRVDEVAAPRAYVAGYAGSLPWVVVRDEDGTLRAFANVCRHKAAIVCEGAGTIKLETNFLPPAYVKCESCNGSRFNRETLDIEYAGKNIAQVLDLSVAEGIEFFSALPKIRRPLEALRDTGLDYLRLGQTSPTLSGGEAQRVKLVTHLLTGLKNEQPDLRSIRPLNTKPAIFILEEPTIGLHMTDVQKLVEVIQRLVEAGNTVVAIEHNLDLIAEADWVIDRNCF